MDRHRCPSAEHDEKLIQKALNQIKEIHEESKEIDGGSAECAARCDHTHTHSRTRCDYEGVRCVVSLLGQL